MSPTSTDIATKLREYDANKVTSTDALNTAMATYGVPEIRNTVSGLRTTLANTTNALNAVDPSVTGRTSGSLVTEAQRSKQVNNERAPIAQQLSSQGALLGQNESDLRDALGLATNEATNKVNDYNAGRTALESEYGRTYKTEQDAQAARLAAQQMEEQKRQFNAQQATKAPAAPNKTQMLSQISNGLATNVGKDGKVSNETWHAALNDFVSLGGTPRQFWQNYGSYVNPKYAKSYAGYNVR